jgi:hypothetical protein
MWNPLPANRISGRSAETARRGYGIRMWQYALWWIRLTGSTG